MLFLLRQVLRLACPLILSLALPASILAAMPMLHADGTNMADEQNHPVTLRGCNLGNWLLIEAWMLKWDIEDQATIERTLESRFSKPEKDRLMELYREGYITSRDFEIVKRFNFNVVRVPFNYTLLLDESGNLRADAFKWLDRALQMAEEAQVYVILDMHGAPGRQSIDHCTGERGKNQLWTDETAQNQMADLWRRIAERYKDRSIIAAYDLLNEPFGDFRSDMREPLRKLMPKIYQAVRSAGDQHVVLFPQALGRGVGFYDDPHASGMTNVGFTDHLYPGLFGSPPTVASHAGVFARTIPDIAEFLNRVKSPMLIGEFNVVLHKAGGRPMMRKYYDAYAQHGWMATMWSYKILKPSPGVQPDNWYMATNAEALPAIDVRTSSLSEIEAFFTSLKTMPLAVDEELRSALTAPVAPSMPLPPVVELPRNAPSVREVGDWKLNDIDSSPASGVAVKGDSLSIFAGGSDIFGNRDSFAFLSKPCGSTATIRVTLKDVLESDTWTKAGVILRFGDLQSSDYAAAPFVMLHAFPNGGIAFTVRDAQGGVAKESKRVIGPLPRQLMLVRDGAKVQGYADAGDGKWLLVGEAQVDAKLPANIGLAVCSHRDGHLTRSTFEGLTFTSSAESPAVTDHANSKVHRTSNGGLLKNASFEVSSDWNHWGDGVRIADGVARFAPASATSGDSGIWQDIEVEPGSTYRLNVLACRENGDVKDQQLSISLEAEVNGGQVALADRSVDLAELEQQGGWSEIHLSCVAPSKTLRVLVRGSPKTCGIIVDHLSLIKTDENAGKE